MWMCQYFSNVVLIYIRMNLLKFAFFVFYGLLRQPSKQQLYFHNLECSIYFSSTENYKIHTRG